jgi:tetratricopeptide repeat protein 30
MYPEATRAAIRVEGEQYSQKVIMLQSIIKYEQDELQSCKSLLDQCHDDPDVLVNYAAISFKEGKYDKARQQYLDVMNMVGYSPDLAYNIALCFYREKNFIAALKYISEIVEKGVRNHPELSVGSRTGIAFTIIHSLTCLLS